MGAEVPQGVDSTRAAVGQRHGVGSSWRRRLGMGGIVFAHRAMRSLRKARKGFGFLGPLALQLRRRGFGRWLRGHCASAWPEIMQHDAEPQESQNRELVIDMLWNHDRAPSSWCDKGALYPVWRAEELPVRYWYTTQQSAVKATTQTPTSHSSPAPSDSHRPAPSRSARSARW
jgi:hypothetical protein